MKITIWCKGVTYNWRKYAVKTADGMWTVGWCRDEDFIRTYQWQWKCKAKHITHDLIDKPVLYGGSKYGYEMCMQNLREHVRKYHG